MISTSNLRSIGISQSAAYRLNFCLNCSTTFSQILLFVALQIITPLDGQSVRNVPTLLSFADFFSNRSPRQFLRNIALRALLDPRVFPCVSNYNLNASISVSRALFYPKSASCRGIGSGCVPKNSKTRAADVDRPSAFFAGALTEAKGVGDCLQAVALLKKRGINLIFEFAGPVMWKFGGAALCSLRLEIGCGSLALYRIRTFARE